TINYNRSAIKNAIIPFFDGSMAPMAVFMPLLMMVYGRLENKTYEENTGYLLTLSLGTNTALTFAAKMLIKRKRIRTTIVQFGVYPKVFAIVDPFSFPSGHSSTAFSVATMMTLRYPSYPLIYIPMYL